MENKKKYRKYQNKNKDNTEDLVRYRTKQEGPVKKADWQLKLMAISDCIDKQNQPNFNQLVEARYQELWHKENK